MFKLNQLLRSLNILIIDNLKMTRYENKHTKAQSWYTIYIWSKNDQCLKMESNQWYQCACMCLEWMFCDCILVYFKLKLKYELIKLGKRGTPDIPESTWSMSKTKPLRLPVRNMWAEMESLGLLFIMHPLGCDRYRCPEVTFQKFPLPLGILPPWWFDLGVGFSPDGLSIGENES